MLLRRQLYPVKRVTAGFVRLAANFFDLNRCQVAVAAVAS